MFYILPGFQLGLEFLLNPNLSEICGWYMIWINGQWLDPTCVIPFSIVHLKAGPIYISKSHLYGLWNYYNLQFKSKFFWHL